MLHVYWLQLKMPHQILNIQLCCSLQKTVKVKISDVVCDQKYYNQLICYQIFQIMVICTILMSTIIKQIIWSS